MAKVVLSDFTNAGGVSYFIQRGQATLNFGALPAQSNNAIITVSAPWVTSSSIIILTIAAIATADHSADEVSAELIHAYVTNIVNGVSFDIVGISPSKSFGAYLVNYMGG